MGLPEAEGGRGQGPSAGVPVWVHRRYDACEKGVRLSERRAYAGVPRTTPEGMSLCICHARGIGHKRLDFTKGSLPAFFYFFLPSSIEKIFISTHSWQALCWARGTAVTREGQALH